jgi:putative aldouronate transport system permease protein
MIGVIIAFKDVNYSLGILRSPWAGLKNFQYLFATNDAFIITRNTLLYNLSFIILDIAIPVSLALLLNELRGRFLPRLYHTIMLFPYFMSMVVVSYLVFAMLSHQNGLMNVAVLPGLGREPINWYAETRFWPFILPTVHVWKTAGYTTIIYLAALAGIDTSYYDAAAIDGAGKWKQARYISVPFLKPVIIILSILAVGRIFYSDFGLFYQVPLNSGALYSVTNVIDTYVYRGLTQTNDLGMASAAGFYQSLVGFVLVLTTNTIVRRYDTEQALF